MNEKIKKIKSYSENSHDQLYLLAKELLKLHNNELSLNSERLLKPFEEDRLSGCIRNISYGSQSLLTYKQLKMLEVLLNKYKTNLSNLNQLKLLVIKNEKINGFVFV